MLVVYQLIGAGVRFDKSQHTHIYTFVQFVEFQASQSYTNIEAMFFFFQIFIIY